MMGTCKYYDEVKVRVLLVYGVLCGRIILHLYRSVKPRPQQRPFIQRIRLAYVQTVTVAAGNFVHSLFFRVYFILVLLINAPILACVLMYFCRISAIFPFAVERRT